MELLIIKESTRNSFMMYNNSIPYFSFKKSTTINPDWLITNQSKGPAPLLCHQQNLCHPTLLTGKSNQPFHE